MAIHKLASIKFNGSWLINALQVGLVYAVLINSAFALPRYTITDIGFGANDINNKGQVAGSGVSSATQGKSHAFRYTDGIGQEDLGVVPKFVPADTSIGSGINDLGQVVGTSGDNAFRYTDGVGMENLNDQHCSGLNTCLSSASEINNAGKVIGDWYGTDIGIYRRAVRFTDGIAKEIYGTVQNDLNSYGIDINNAGQWVGYSAGNLQKNHAIRFTDGLGLEYLGSLGGSINSGGEYSWGVSVSKAYGINTAGQVTGQSSTTSLRWHGFLYTDGVGMQDLGVLQGDDSSQGIEINDSGQIVGHSWSTNGGLNHPVLWSQPGCPEDLNLAVGVKDSGWVLSEVRAINNSGQIVGSGKNPAGESHGFRLTPAGAGIVLCSVSPTPAPTPGANPITLPGSSATIEPNAWNTVSPLQSCITQACKNKLAKNRKLLKAKAMLAIKTKKAANNASAKINRGNLDQRKKARADAAKKQAIAAKARRQYDQAVIAVQALHD